jgi:hypothetical protein
MADPSNGVYDLTYLKFADSRLIAHESGWDRRNPFGRLVFTTTETSVSLTTYSVGSSAYDNRCVLWRIGTGAWTTLYVDEGTNAYTLTLGAGTKTVEILDGPQLYVDGTNDRGSWIVSVTVPAGHTISVATPAAPTNRLVIYGASIENGWCQESGSPVFSASYAWPIQLRTLLGGAWGVTVLGGAGQPLWPDISSSGNRSALVSVIGARMDGSASNALWLTNTHNSCYNSDCTLAQFQSAYGAFLDAMHSSKGAAKLYCQSPTSSSWENTANWNNETKAQYRTAETTEANSRAPWSSLVNGTTLASYPSQFLADGIHPTQAGQTAIAGAAQTVVRAGVTPLSFQMRGAVTSVAGTNYGVFRFHIGS